MPTDALEQKEFMPPRQKRAALPGPSSRTIGRLRTVTDETGSPLVRDMGTYWSTVAGGDDVPFFSVKDFGAAGDGSTDDTAAINLAIAAANAVSTTTLAQGAVVYFPPGVYVVSATLTAPTKNVTLLGAGVGKIWNSDSDFAQSVIQATHKTTAILSLGSSGNGYITIAQLGFKGAGASSSSAGLTSYGIYAVSASGLQITNCNFDNFGGSAIRWDAGTGIWLTGVEVTNSLLDYASLSGQAGVVQCGGSEIEFLDCNINGNILPTVHSLYGSGYFAAIYCTGAPVRASHSVGAFAQNGWVLAGASAPSALYDCRGEYCQGYGFVISGSQFNLTDCAGFANGMATDDTYYGIYLKDSVFNNGNSIDNFKLASLGSGDYATYRMAGLLLDDVGQGSDLRRTNRLSNPMVGFNTLAHTNGIWYKPSGNTDLIVVGDEYVQTLTGTGTQTFNGALGSTVKLVVNANTSTTLAATRLLLGHYYSFEILNSSGATPAIALDTVFKTVGYTAPADTKRKTFRCKYDGTNLILIGAVSADF